MVRGLTKADSDKQGDNGSSEMGRLEASKTETVNRLKWEDRNSSAVSDHRTRIAIAHRIPGTILGDRRRNSLGSVSISTGR